jgi:hypothetical protein
MNSTRGVFRLSRPSYSPPITPDHAVSLLIGPVEGAPGFAIRAIRLGSKVWYGNNLHLRQSKCQPA